MSYPRTITPLVIEDDPRVKPFYDAVFKSIAKTYSLTSPRFAFCYQDAIEAIEESRPYHLVVLDLCLPDRPGEPAPPGIELGLELAAKCARRDTYPIPVLLVLSGNLDKADQHALSDTVERNFAWGRVFVKSPNNEKEIVAAICNAQSYCDLGIHIRDGIRARFPTISPREEDLIRRAILEQGDCIGVDLQWWSAEHQHFTQEPEQGEWTKTLMGRFWAAKGAVISHPTFFKLAPASGAETVLQEARTLQQVLPHIKVCSSQVAGGRSLLVTQKVGESTEPPVSLVEFLSRDPAQVAAHVPAIVAEVVSQVERLGDRAPDQLPARQLMWPYHSVERIRQVWERWGGTTISKTLGVETDPIEVAESVLKSEALVRYSRQSWLHGDLNASNIAIDEGGDRPRAYIFDASGCGGGVNIRDLAALEITSLLHYDLAQNNDDFELIRLLYLQPTPAEPSFDGDALAMNRWCFVTNLRHKAVKISDPAIYALMVFDQALLQFGGLSFQVTGNKISSPSHAAALTSLAADWLTKMFPSAISNG